MTVFTDNEQTLLTLAASRPEGTVLLADLDLGPVGPCLEPAAVRLHTAGLLDFREVPRLHYRLTGSGWAAARQVVAS